MPTSRSRSRRGAHPAGGTRHRHVGRGHIHGITKKDIRRLARRGGVKRISGLVYEEARKVLKSFLQSTIKDAVTYCHPSGRQTLATLDVVHALKHKGRTMYGFGA